MKHIYISIRIMAIVGLTVLTSSCVFPTYRDTPTVRVVSTYSPIVVNISTEQILDLKQHPAWGEYGEQLDMLFKQYYGEAYSKGILKRQSIGSGVILDNDGRIVTNAHVIDRASSIYVILNDGTVLEAKPLVKNQNDDLAIIKTDLPYPVKKVKYADINDLKIGETVIAIGNPLGLENSVTVGVISGKDRAFASSQCGYVCSGLLQTDASINPGNSGGALLNLDGELIGINLAVIQNAQNIGFAIPVDKIMNLLESYK